MWHLSPSEIKMQVRIVRTIVQNQHTSEDELVQIILKMLNCYNSTGKF